MSAKRSQPERLSTSIRVRLTPSEKRELERLVDQRHVTMAHAFRRGIWSYLTGRSA